MCGKTFINVVIFLVLVSKPIETEMPQTISSSNSGGLESAVHTGDDEGKSSLVFVFDTTGSMYDDLRQLREGAELILNTALEESNVIADFVFVPFHDPAVGPATVTKDKEVFKAALNIVRVYGGGDCPEKSLGGIMLALRVSRPRSFVYVFTDATASDHGLVGKVLDSIQRKQSQVVFVLTGHCNDLDRPSFRVYQQIAAASSGQVFNLNKTNVHKVLDFVRSVIKGRTVNLGAAVDPPGYNNSRQIPVDSTLGEVTVAVSGSKPRITVVNPSGARLSGPPQLVTALDLSEVMVVKVLQPEPGNWTITTGSEAESSVRVAGVSDVGFAHGFSVQRPASAREAGYRPLQGAYNHLMISLTETDSPVQIAYAELLSLDGNTLFEVPLKQFDRERNMYLSDAFVPPDDLFYIAINGHDQFNQELRRVGATAVQARAPDVPHLSVSRRIEGRPHERVVVACDVESAVPVTAMWTKDTVKISPQISSLQSTSIEHLIEDMGEQNVGLYECVARNVAGVSKALSEVTLLVVPPHVTIAPENKTIQAGENVTVSCTVVSESLLTRQQLLFNGTLHRYDTEMNLEPNMFGFYTFNKTVNNASERDSGVYSCVAANRGGTTTQSSHITVQSQPSAQILGPHTLTKHIHTDIQLVCHVENADKVVWVAPNGTAVREYDIDGSFNDMLDVKNVSEEGVWTCMAERDRYRVTDRVEINILIKPEAVIEGDKNITILNGSSHHIVCQVTAKPAPRIVWHRETEAFLNNTITLLAPNVYRSVLTLDSSAEAVEGTYFCFGENSQGIGQDSAAVRVRRAMTLVEGFTDGAVELYSQIQLRCVVDSHPRARLQWFHNGTGLETSDDVHLSEDNSVVYIQKVDFYNLGAYCCAASDGYETIHVNASLNVVGLESPALSKEPKVIKTQKGKSTILTCRVIEGNPEPTISWQFKTNASEHFTDLPQDVLFGKNNSELIIMTVEIDHFGEFRCSANNIIGRDVYDVLLLVQYPPALHGEAREGPLELEAGGKATFSCPASGVPLPAVVWTKDGQPIVFSKNVYLSDESDLVIVEASEYDSGSYTCNATSALGSSQRNFTLVVYVPPAIAAPGVEPQQEVLEGQLVELPCAARGAPPPETRWLQDGAAVQGGRKHIDEFGIRFVANLTDFGEYTCVASNPYGTASSSFTLHVWVAPFIQPPSETSEAVLVGSDVTLGCDAVGFPVPSIVWEFRGEPLVENTTDLSFDEVGNVFVRDAGAEHEGWYACVAENVAGVAAKSIYLNVNEPPRILQDNFTAPYIATNKDTALAISCAALGKPAPHVAWTKDDVYLDNDSRYDIGADGTLTIRAPSEELAGLYTCVASSAAGRTSWTVPVEVYALPSRSRAEESETSVAVTEGSDASIACPVRAAQTDTVKWYKDAKLISHGPLQISNASRHDTSSYACVVANAVGSAYAAVRVNVEWPPRFVEGEAPDVRIVKGGDTYLDCRVDARPLAKTRWLFNSKALLGDEDRLKLINIQPRHSGTYKCIVTNMHGTIARQFALDVLVPPFISEFDLLDVQLKQGASAALECSATGSPAPEIKWTFSNTNWYIRNSSLVARDVSQLSEGLFRCDARNAAGSARVVYRVTVVAPALVDEVTLFDGSRGVTVAGSLEVVVGTRIRIACSASGKPAPTVRWIRHGRCVSENSDHVEYADLVLHVQAAHAGAYACVAANEGGGDERTLELDVLEPPKIFQTLFQNPNSSDTTTKLEVLSGQAFHLHCHPTGRPPPATYWFKDGLPLRLFDDTMLSADYGETVVSRGARLDQSGNYTCVARNRVGDASVVYLVDVLVPPPAPKGSPEPVSVRLGQALNLTCPAEGSPRPRVVWIKHPYTEISGTTPRVLLLSDNFTLIVNNSEVSDSGEYSCAMTNRVGTAEKVFDVTVMKPPSIAGGDARERRVVPLRRGLVLACRADGHPPPEISWLKDTQRLGDSSSNIQRVLGSSLLAIWSAGARDAGQYICVAENGAGVAHRRYDVALQVPGKWSAWSQWSYCDVTCGAGHQSRARLCFYTDEYNVTYDKSSKSDKILLDESACRGPAGDRRRCHMPACEEDETQMRWSMWSKWSQCSASCGAGTQARTRRCRSQTRCRGDDVQIRKCSGLSTCDSKQDVSDDATYDSSENATGTGAYTPEATFEMQPEVVNTQYSTDTEEFHVRSDSKYPVVYYEVNATEDSDGSGSGACAAGFRRNPASGACDDVDECALETNRCHLTQVCVNAAGGYRCACAAGFVSLGAGQRCLDINECEQDIHGCAYACVNVAGGYVCACPRHLRLHRDRHHCVSPSSRREPRAHDAPETQRLPRAAARPRGAQP